MSHLIERKAGIRKAMLARRRGLSLERQGVASKKILEFLKENFNWARLNRVALYRAVGGEIPTAAVESWLRSQGVALFFPRTDPENGTIEMVAMGSADRWERSPWGIEEPPREKPQTAPGGLDLAILPGLAFDRAGRRVGRGRGCYDRWLKDFSGIRVGLAHPFQLVEEIPEEPLDQGVDFIVTPQEIWRVPKKE
jgi:5-formyltetrahydrofolate cyclo-ligase